MNLKNTAMVFDDGRPAAVAWKSMGPAGPLAGALIVTVVPVALVTNVAIGPPATMLIWLQTGAVLLWLEMIERVA